jgi:hypothetical protein
MGVLSERIANVNPRPFGEIVRRERARIHRCNESLCGKISAVNIRLDKRGGVWRTPAIQKSAWGVFFDRLFSWHGILEP